MFLGRSFEISIDTRSPSRSAQTISNMLQTRQRVFCDELQAFTLQDWPRRGAVFRCSENAQRALIKEMYTVSAKLLIPPVKEPHVHVEGSTIHTCPRGLSLYSFA